MALLDSSWAADKDADKKFVRSSLNFVQTADGYMVARTDKMSWQYRVVFVLGVLFFSSLMVFAGLLWAMGGMDFPNQMSMFRATTATLIYSASLVFAYRWYRGETCDAVLINQSNRSVHILLEDGEDMYMINKSFRFDQVADFGLAEVAMSDGVKSTLNKWDYGRLTMTLMGGKTLNLLGGDMTELGPVLKRLRADTKDTAETVK